MSSHQEPYECDHKLQPGEECQRCAARAANAICDNRNIQWPFECAGRKQALPEPGECNWPDCGCDPHATKVIESLVEQGWSAPSRPDAGGDVREALEIGRFYADLHHQAAMKLMAFAQASSCKEDIERIDAALSTPSDAGNASTEAREAIAALQAMLRLFDDQGNMVADFNAVQSAVENGYAVISRQARSEASANGL